MTQQTLPKVVQQEIFTESDSIEYIGQMLREAVDDAMNWTQVGGERAPATHTGGLRIWDYPNTTIRGRNEGRFHPFYEDEWELTRMRAACRRLATFTSIAVGAQKALQVYVMGGDWEYEVVARKGMEPSEELIKECQVVLDANLEKNEFIACLDNEIHDATVEDGEVLIAGYADPDGLTDLRLLSADLLREPKKSMGLDNWLTPGSRGSWSFGVHTKYDARMKRIDHTRHAGYHVIFDDAGQDYDYLPAWPQVSADEHLGGKFGHLIKRNVPQTAKRGISDYWPVLNDLEREDKLNENLSVGAAIQAAIAWIEEMPPNTTKAAAQQSITNSLDQWSRALKANTGAERDQRRFRAGSVQRVENGRKYHAGPMGASRTPIFIDAGKAVVRRIGIRWVFPYYMISGDASESSLASTLVAEAPFVKARQADQQFYAGNFRQMRFKELKIAADHGRFRKWGIHRWADLRPVIDVLITPSPVASRDKATQLEELFGLYDRAIMDANEVRTQLKLEEKEELDGQTGALPQAGMDPNDPDAEDDRDKPVGDGERTKPNDKLPKAESDEWAKEVERRSSMVDSSIWQEYDYP